VPTNANGGRWRRWRRGVKVSTVVGVLAVLSLAIFAALWLWIAVDLMRFNPTPGHPTYDVGDNLIALASLFGTTVAVGTAAVLGIEIQKLKQLGTLTTTGVLSPLIAAGVFTYAAVGAAVLGAWLANQSVSPDVVKAFSMTFAGWILGGFAAIFRAAQA
jgi:hypothetical protein